MKDDNLLAEANEVVLGEEEEIAEENEAEEIAEANNYSISFDLNIPAAEANVAYGNERNSTSASPAYGTEQSGTTYAEGAGTDEAGHFNEPNAPTRIGYKFGGWQMPNGTKVTFTNKVSDQTVNGATTLTAQWTSEPVRAKYYWKTADAAYALGYTDDAGTFDAPIRNNDSRVPTIENNKALNGWYLATSDTGTAETVVDASRWYVAGEAQYPAGKTAADFTVAKLLANATYNNKLTRVSTGTAGDYRWEVSLYAGYTTTYRVTFFDNSDNDKQFGAIQVKPGQTIDSPHVGHSVAAGLSFDKWKTKDNNGDYIDLPDTIATYNATTKKLTFNSALNKDAEMYATYTADTHTITFRDVANDRFTAFDPYGSNATGVATTATYRSGAKTVAPTYEIKSGNNIDITGWIDTTGAPFTFGSTLDKDVTLIPLTKTVYWVHFMTEQDGTGSTEEYPFCPRVAVDPTVNGGKVSKPSVDPSYKTSGGTIYKLNNWYEGTKSGITGGSTVANRIVFDFDKAITSETWIWAGYTQATNASKVKIRYRDPDEPTGWNENIQYVESGKTATAPTLPTVEGFTFTGWKDVDRAAAFSFDTKIERDYNVEAQYTETKWTVTFDTLGGSTLTPVEVSAANPYLAVVTYSGTDVKKFADANPTKGSTTTPVWTFKGLYTDANLTQKFNLIDEPMAGTAAGSGVKYDKSNATKITGNMTLYAKFVGVDCTVNFEIAAGDSAKGAFASTAVTTMQVPYGSPISQGKTAIPAIETKPGYTFAGWVDSAGKAWPEDKAVEPTDPTTATTLTAKFVSDILVVKFESNGGTAVAEQRVAAGGKLSNSGAYEFAGDKRPTKTGYKLYGWYDNPEFTGDVYFDTQCGATITGRTVADYTVNKNATFYARWAEAEWDIEYITGGASAGKDTGYMGKLDAKYTKVKDGALLEKPNIDPDGTTGKAFAGWYTNLGSDIAYDFTKPVTANKKLYAKFVDGVAVTFKVNKTGAGYETGYTQNVLLNGTATAPAANLNTQYGKFVEWVDEDPLTAGSGWKKFDLSTALTTANTAAVNGQTYRAKVLYARYDTGANQVPVTFNLGTPVETTTNGTTTPGAKWADGTATTTTSKTVYIAANTALTAGDIPSIVWTEGAKTLSGWTDGQGNPFELTTTITGAKSLTPVWAAKTYTATFMDGTTTLGTIGNIGHDSTLTDAQLAQFAAAKTGYTFDGWFTNASLTSAQFTNTTHIKADTTLYAKYTPKKVYVKLVLGNGNPPTGDTNYKKATSTPPAGSGLVENDYYVEVNYGGTLPALKNPTSTDGKLAFANWCTDNQLKNAFVPTTQFKANTTLYAKYMNAVGITLTATGWTYDGTSHAATNVKATAAAGNANETAPTPTVQYKVKGAADSTYTTTAPVNANTYVVKASVPATATTAAAEATAEFTIYQKEVTLTWATVTELPYTGAEQAPAVTVNGTVNGESASVIVSGKGKAVGSYTATATMPETGNYKLAPNAKTACPFTIVQSTTAPTVSATVDNGVVTITVKAADGTVISTSTVKVGESGATDDFTITTKDNGDGTATVTLTAKPTAGFKLDKPIEVKAEAGATPTPTKPNGTSIAKLKIAKKKKVVASWTAVTDVDGYEVQYGLKKTKGLKTKDVPGATSASVTLKLKKGKKYFFRIRTYKKDATGTKVYSDWSAWKKSKKVK